MNEIMQFSFETSECRTVMIENRPWWVGKDVCNILAYKDASNALKLHCRGVAKYHPIVDSLGRTQNVRIINEPDLYRLGGHSKLPNAQKFERWIYEDVIPSIMRTGSYNVSNPDLNLFEKLMQMEKSIANIEISLTRLYLPSVEQNDEASVKQFIKDYIVIESALQYETKSDVWEKYKEFYGKKIKMHDFVELFLSLLPSCEMSITNLGAGRKQLCFFGISMKKAKKGG